MMRCFSLFLRKVLVPRHTLILYSSLDFGVPAGENLFILRKVL